MIKNIIFALAAIAIVAIQCKPSGGAATGTTEQGFKYEHIHKTDGKVAAAGDQVMIHYKGEIGDKKLGSTWEQGGKARPFEILSKAALDTIPEANLKGLFWPLHEATSMMGVGDTMIVYQPIDDDMRRGMSQIIDSTDMEIKLTIYVDNVFNKEEAEAAAKAEQEEAQAAKAAAVIAAAPHVIPGITADLEGYKAGTLKVNTLPTGVKVAVKEAGTGKAITEGEPVEVNYYGILTADGSNFDDSYSRGKPLSFAAGVGQMIPGFDQAVMSLRHGAKATIFIPSDLAYGPQGRPGIPANSELAFYIEIL